VYDRTICVGVVFFDFAVVESLIKRSSGTLTMPTFGSIVQNGKFFASAFFVLLNYFSS
jgi:hypothetical protein